MSSIQQLSTDEGPSPTGADPLVSAIGFDDLPPALAELLRPRFERLGYLGEFFQRTAHEPGGLGTFIAFTETSKDSVPKRIVELIALTMATLAENHYEKHRHERLSVRSGFGRDWVARVEALDPDSLGDPDETIVQRYLIAADRHHGHAAGPLFAPIVARVGEQAAIAMLFVAGRYLVHSLIAIVNESLLWQEDLSRPARILGSDTGFGTNRPLAGASW